MTKAAAIKILAAVLVATAFSATVVVGAETDAAISEAVRRDANKILLVQKLEEASRAVANRDLGNAAKLYDAAVSLVDQIGAVNCELEAGEAIRGFAGVRLQLAELARKRGDFREVDVQLNRILKVDPKNSQALLAKQQNDKTLRELRGQIPTDAAVSEARKGQEALVESNTHVQNARVLLESGRLDQAEAELDQALQLVPGNPSALRYKELLRNQRYQISLSHKNRDNGEKILEVVNTYADRKDRDRLPVPNPYNRVDTVHTGKGRQAIYEKLNSIKFDIFPPEGSPDSLPLSEIVRILGQESPKRDPNKEGVNIMIDPTRPAQAAATAVPMIDPATGLPLPPQPSSEEEVDVGSINVRFGSPLRRVTLNQVLDAITTVAERPLKISYREYAIYLSLKGQETTPLFTRQFDLDPNTFYQGLVNVTAEYLDIASQSSGGGGGGGGGGGASGQSSYIIPRVSVTGQTSSIGGQGGGGGGGSQQQLGGGIPGITTTNSMEAVSATARQFFFNLGINLDPALGKSVFFNDRKGILLVRATAEELDLIEQVIRVMNVAPPLVNIKTRFTEISQNDSKALGFDWFLGNLMVGNKSALSGGTQPSFTGSPSQANPGGFFPGTGPSGIIPPSAGDQLLSGGLRNTFGTDATDIPALASFTGILTDPQFRVVLRAIEQRDGIELLNEGQITTLSGRQAQIQVVEVKTIVTGVDQSQGNQGGVAATSGSGTVNQAVAATFQTPNTSPVPLGPVIDVLPTVSSDGVTIQMAIIPTYTEFVGYDLTTAQSFVPTAITGTGATLAGTLPLPVFRVRQLATSCIVWDGQTVVLGGLISDTVTKQKDKVPFLADIPLMGKLFTSESSQTKKKNLVIFVTPRIIDPAGNPAHADNELPFAQGATPQINSAAMR
ncbi:MAG TPA: hypothetical protein PKN95_07310 [Verrucomicrobiota bacterium]|nr:hypothetical protein [Verrucomicrobiota bacterium]HNT15039.1 hypothetical protein [Verrucomicrobiota bacterium]